MGIYCFGQAMKIASCFNPKAKLWIKGRKNVFNEIKNNIKPDDSVIWMHVASLGEYEQGLPVLENLKKQFPNHKFAISFFSPSGYEIIKNKNHTDFLFYLPLDTKKNAQKLINTLHPDLAIFIKYDFWFNLLNELHKKSVKTVFISAIFRNNQIFFKKWGKWPVSILKKVSYFFVQNENSLSLLNSIGIKQAVVSGDTRFDRVKSILKNNNKLKWLEDFKQDKRLIVAGSTWKKDDLLFESFLKEKNFSSSTKIILAPHNIDTEYLKFFKQSLNSKAILYSELENQDLSSYSVLILDTMGILTKVYSYADIAYVGGGFGKEGIHNILEPAVFATPVIYGPIFDKFIEAKELLDKGGAKVINNQQEFNSVFMELISDSKKRKEMGDKAQKYILNKPNSLNIISKLL